MDEDALTDVVDAINAAHAPHEDTGGGVICTCGWQETRHGPTYNAHVLDLYLEATRG